MPDGANLNSVLGPITLDPPPPPPVDPAAPAVTPAVMNSAVGPITIDPPSQQPTTMNSVVGPITIDPPATTMAPDAGAGPISYTMEPAQSQPPQETGFLSGLFSGAGAAVSEGAQTLQGQAFTDQPNAQPEPQRGFFNELGYGIGHSFPMIGSAIGGGAAGGAVAGPGGALVGSALGAGLMAAAQDLAPTYAAIRQANPNLTHEEAVDYALKHATISGGVMGITAPLFAWAPFKGILGKLLFQSFVTQPAVGGVARVATPALMGEPLPSGEEMVKGLGQDIATGAIFAGGHAIGGRVARALRPGEAAVTPPAEAPAETPAPPVAPPELTPTGAVPQAEPPVAPAAPEPRLPAPSLPETPTMPAPSPRLGEPVAEPPAGVSVPPRVEPSPLPPEPVTSEGAPVDRSITPTPPGEPVPAGTSGAGEAGPPGVVAPAEPQRADGEGVAGRGPPGDQGAVPAPITPEPTPRPAAVSEPVGAVTHPYATVDIRPNPGGGFDVETPLEGIQHAATMEEAQRLAARYTRLDGAQAARYEQETGRNYADDWRNNEVDAEAARRAATAPAEGLTTEPDTENPSQFVAHDAQGRGVAIGDTPEHALELARLRGQPITDPGPTPPGLTVERDHDTPSQFVAKDVEGHVVAIGDTPQHALEMAGQREATRPGGELGAPEAAAAPPERQPSSQLQKLIATRDEMTRPGYTRLPQEERRLPRLNQQIENLTRSESLQDRKQPSGPRVGGRKQPFAVPQEGQPKTFMDYKFNNGLSVEREVLRQAGYDPATALNQLTAVEQNKVLSEHMQKTFGFRDVQVAGDSTQVDRHLATHAMLDMTRAAQDLMASLNLPYEAASLNGRLKLEIEPAGKRNYFGQYEPGSGTLRVVGGANSFGHEWTHAIDHMMAERMSSNPIETRNLLTRYAQQDKLDPKDGPQGAFARVLNTLFYNDAARALREMNLIAKSNQVDRAGNPTAAALKAKADLAALERGNLRLKIQPSEFRQQAGAYGFKPRYMMDPVELLARAHESYLSRQMENNGVDPRGVVMPSEAYLNETDRALKMLYPKADEQMAIFRAFDDWHDEMAKADILSEGKPPGAFANYGRSDPSHYNVTLPPGQANTAEAQASRAAVNSFSNRVKNILTGTHILFDPNRPPPPLNMSLPTQLADGAAGIGMANGSILNRIIKRAPAAAKAALQEIKDRLDTDPGSRRYTPKNLEEARSEYTGKWGQKFVDDLRKAGFDPTRTEQLTAEQIAMVHHAMITGESTYPPDLNRPDITKPIPRNLQVLAGDMRDLADMIWQANHDAGIDIGYTDRYFPRFYDRAAIFTDQPGFLDQAQKVYRIGFDREIGAPGADPQSLLEKWTTLSKTDRDTADPDVARRMTELGQNLRRQREIETFPTSDPGEPAELARLKAEAQQMAVDAHPLVRDHVAMLEASNWLTRMSSPDIHNYDTTGPSGRYLNMRTLPPEADTLLRDYMHNSILDAYPAYIKAAAHRVADAERFGSHAEDLQRLMDAASAAGLQPADRTWFANTVATIRGANRNHDEKVQQLIQWAHAGTSVALMPRSAYSGLSEPMYSYMVTGKMLPALQTFANQVGQLFRTANAADRTRLAQMVGVSHAAGFENIMTARLGNDYSNTPKVERFMTRFYRTIGMTSLVNSQRAAAVAPMDHFIKSLAEDYQTPGSSRAARYAREDAANWFKELGLPENAHDGFVKAMDELGGEMPSTRWLQTHDMAGAYSLAMRRLVDRQNQNPTIAGRAAGASGNLGLLFQLMSFNYSIAKNVLGPLFNRIEFKYGRAKLEAINEGAGPISSRIQGTWVAGGAALHAAAMVGGVMAAAIPALIVKMALFDPDRLQKLIDDGDWGELFDQAWSRAGLNAQFDPIIQVLSHTKYEADISSLLEGAGPNFIAKNLMDVVTPMVASTDTPNTNTRMFNATRGALNLAGVPLTSYALTAAGGFGGLPGRVLAGAALQYLTSPGFVSGVAAVGAGGAKGTKLPEPGEGGLAKLQGLEGLGKLQGLAKLGEPTPPGDAGSGGVGGGLWGFGDDIAMPAWRKIGPVLSHVPGPIKAGAIGAAALYGGAKYLEASEPFRGQPAPKPKAAAP